MRHRFFQKPNEQIWVFFDVTSKKANKQIHSFIFGSPICLWFYLTFDFKMVILPFFDRESMQPSHSQCSSEMPQNPKGEQQGFLLFGSHSLAPHLMFGSVSVM